jgi:adenylate kinase family enzyme
MATVIDFALPIEISRERLMGRQEGRADDKPGSDRKRLNDHQRVELSVMPYYRAKDWSNQSASNRSMMRFTRCASRSKCIKVDR